MTSINATAGLVALATAAALQVREPQTFNENIKREAH